MTWTSLPQAAALLRSCGENPPERDMRTGSFERPTPYFRRDDPRVRELRQIHRASMPEMDTPEWIEWAECDEMRAIREAIEQHRQRKAA